MLLRYFVILLTGFNIQGSLHQPQPSTLSLEQQFQLDFINQQINQNKDVFQQDWNTSDIARLVIDSVELAVNQSSQNTRLLMEQSIVAMFQKINISVFFSDDSMIQLERHETTQEPKNAKRGFHLKKQRRHFIPTTTSFKIPVPKKIKGARRTLRRIKAKYFPSAQKKPSTQKTEYEFMKREHAENIDHYHESIQSRDFFRVQEEAHAEHAVHPQHQNRAPQEEPIHHVFY